MDLPNPEFVTVKMESGTGVEGEVELTDMEIDLSDVKQECLENSMEVEQTAGKNYIENVFSS